MRCIELLTDNDLILLYTAAHAAIYTLTFLAELDETAESFGDNRSSSKVLVPTVGYGGSV